MEIKEKKDDLPDSDKQVCLPELDTTIEKILGAIFHKSVEKKSVQSDINFLAYYLLTLYSEEVVSHLVAIIKNRKLSSEKRFGTICSMAMFGHEPEIAIPVLVDCITDKSEDDSIREEALKSIALYRHETEIPPDAVDVIVTVLKDKREKKVIRFTAATILRAIFPEDLDFTVFLKKSLYGNKESVRESVKKELKGCEEDKRQIEEDEITFLNDCITLLEDFYK